MEIVNPNAAGIDVGSRSHFVAIGQQKDTLLEKDVYLWSCTCCLAEGKVENNKRLRISNLCGNQDFLHEFSKYSAAF